MKLKFTQTENVTRYLDLLTERVEHGRKEHLREMGRVLTSEIEQLAPKYNPYLYKSGSNERRWIFDLWDNNVASLYITYSGMTYKEDGFTESNFKAWIEFSKEWEYVEEAYDTGDYDEANYYIYHMRPEERHLNRDYAYFQETGIDKIANPDDAKHKYFIENSINARFKTIANRSAGYMKQIIRGM